MNFADAFNRLDDKMTRREREADIEQRRADYRRVRERIAERLEAAARLQPQVNTFRDGGLPCEEVDPQLSDLAERARELAATWTESPDRVLLHPEVWEPLRQLEETAEMAMEEVYSRFHAEWQSDTLPAFYAVLARNSPHKAAVDQILSIEADLPRLLPESLPTDASRLRRAKSLKAERDQARKDLDAAIPPEIRGLFEKAFRGEATAADLTPALLGQLKDLNAERSLRLALR